MRSKWRRYSSSSASRSPSCARATRARMSAVDSLEAAIYSEMPDRAKRLTRGGRPEADAAFAGEPLDVDDPLEGNRVAPVLGLERKSRLARAGPNGRRTQRLFEGICARRRDQRAHDLPAVEGDFYTHTVGTSQLKPPPRERRGRNPGGR